MAEKIEQLDQIKIMACLKQQGISENDYFKDKQLLAILTNLNGEPFDLQTFNELLDQCKLNSKGEAKAADFVEYLVKAEQILIEKLKDLEINIIKVEFDRKANQKDYSQQKKLKDQLRSLKELKEDVKNTLNIVRKPFIYHQRQIEPLSNFSTPVAGDLRLSHTFEEKAENQLFQYDVTKTAQILTKIMYLTVFLIAINWLGSQLFNRFLDLTTFFVILIGYACQAVSKKIIRFNLLLVTISFVIDFIWLILYTDNLWNPSKNYDYPIKNVAYLKLSIFFVFVTQIMKIALCYYFLSQLQIQEKEVFIVPIGPKNLYMQKQANPPISSYHPLSYALLSLFNRAPPPSVEPPSVQPQIK